MADKSLFLCTKQQQPQAKHISLFGRMSTNTIGSARRRQTVVDTTPNPAVNVAIHHAQEVRQRFAKILSERSLCSDPGAFSEVDEGTAIRGLKCEIASVLSAAEGQSKRNRRQRSKRHLFQREDTSSNETNLLYNLDNILAENERALSLAQAILDKKSTCQRTTEQCRSDEGSYVAGDGETSELARTSKCHLLKEGARSNGKNHRPHERTAGESAKIKATRAA